MCPHIMVPKDRQTQAPAKACTLSVRYRMRQGKPFSYLAVSESGFQGALDPQARCGQQRPFHRDKLCAFSSCGMSRISSQVRELRVDLPLTGDSGGRAKYKD